jgi:CRISPR/Cas system-associated endoribonuclease Cas2
LDEAWLERMMERLELVPLGDEDRVRVYRVCRQCVEHVQIYGPGELTTEPDFYLA